MASNNLPIANERQQVLSFITPLQDILFWERVNILLKRNAEAEIGAPHWDVSNYPNHKLVWKNQLSQDGKWYQFYYAAERDSQDLYNFEFSDADLGNVRYPSVVRTYVELRSEFTDSRWKIGTAMAMFPANAFTGSYVLADAAEKHIDQMLDSIFIVWQLTFIKRSVVRNIGVDQINGKPLSSNSVLYYRGEIVDPPGVAIETLVENADNAYGSFWGLQSNGYRRSGRGLSANWFSVDMEQVVAVDGDSLVKAYTTNDNFYWPPVLREVEFIRWPLKHSPDQIADNPSLRGQAAGQQICPRLFFNPEAYSGPCKTEVSIYWSPTPFTIPMVEQMLPRRIIYSSPFFEVSCPECLHSGWWFAADVISNNDDKFMPTSGTERIFPATNFHEWPDQIDAFDTQESHLGGYLRTRRRVYPPVGWMSNTVSGNTEAWASGIEAGSNVPNVTSGLLGHRDTVSIPFTWTANPTVDPDGNTLPLDEIIISTVWVSTSSDFSRVINVFTIDYGASEATLNASISRHFALTPNTDYYVKLAWYYCYSRRTGNSGTYTKLTTLPDTPVDFAITAKTTTSVSVAFTAPNVAPEFVSDSSSALETEITVIGTGGSTVLIAEGTYSATISGLTAATGYQVKARHKFTRPVTGVTWSNYTDPIIFTTYT